MGTWSRKQILQEQYDSHDTPSRILSRHPNNTAGMALTAVSPCQGSWVNSFLKIALTSMVEASSLLGKDGEKFHDVLFFDNRLSPPAASFAWSAKFVYVNEVWLPSKGVVSLDVSLSHRPSTCSSYLIFEHRSPPCSTLKGLLH